MTIRSSFIPSFVLAVAVIGGAAMPVHADDPALVQLSRTAATPADHARVARQYRLRAEALDAEARAHEAQAAKAAARIRNPIASKTAPYKAPGDDDKRRAVQARRAADEARARALHHLSVAVETFFAAGG